MVVKPHSGLAAIPPYATGVNWLLDHQSAARGPLPGGTFKTRARAKSGRKFGGAVPKIMLSIEGRSYRFFWLLGPAVSKGILFASWACGSPVRKAKISASSASVTTLLVYGGISPAG